MSEQTPYELLGVTDSASFDEIQQARDRLMEKVDDTDGQKVEAIEAAYDAVLMHRLKMRQEGKIKVPEGIRFPERSTPAPSPKPSVALDKLPTWMQDMADQPEPKDIWIPAGITLALIGLTLFFLGNAPVSALQLPLAGGWAAAIYFINRKEGRFGRAVLVSFLALLGGLIIGSLVALLIPAPFLRDTLQLQPAHISAVFSLLVLWATSSFLK